MSRKKLLLADDSVTIQKVVNLTFADEGIDVITVGDGESAMAAIREEKPDIVLADVNMPGPNGYQICEWIRSSDETRSLPVILLVGSFEPFDEEAAVRVGASAYLTKPFQSIRQLVDVVHELIAEAELHSGRSETEPMGEDSEAFETEADTVSTPLGAVSDAPAESEEEDIESLYRRSISEQNHDDFAETFEDFGIDDPTIEMEYAETGSPIAGEGADGETGFAIESNETPAVAGADISDEDEEFFRTIDAPRDINSQPAAESEIETQRLSAEMLGKTQRLFFTDSASGEPAQPAEPANAVSANADSGAAGEKPEDANLLELPPVGVDIIKVANPGAPSPLSAQPVRLVISVSPELVEQIADRIVQKLREKS